MSEPRGGYPCPHADRGCEYAAVVPSLIDLHEATCPDRPATTEDDK